MTEMEWIRMESKIKNLLAENDDLRKRLKNLQDLDFNHLERLKKYENRILDLENINGNIEHKIREAKCELSNQILKCELTDNHYSLILKRFEDKLDKLEDQFLYMKKYIENNENNENSFMKLFGVIIGASWGLILMALFQIFLFHR